MPLGYMGQDGCLGSALLGPLLDAFDVLPARSQCYSCRRSDLRHIFDLRSISSAGLFPLLAEDIRHVQECSKVRLFYRFFGSDFVCMVTLIS